MAQEGKRPATYADIEAAPEHLVAEIIDGELMTHPRPSPRHGFSTSALLNVLMESHQRGRGGPGGWVFSIEPELHLGEDVLVPDIAGWRLSTLASVPETSYFAVRPDWLCEVLSGSTEKRDRTIKSRSYAKAEVAHFWIVDPRQQMLEAFELTNARWVRLGAWNSADEVRAPPFDATSFSLADLWPLDPPLGLNEDPTPYYAGDR